MHKKHVYVLLGNKPNVLKMHQIYIFFFIINPTYFIYLILPHPITLCYNKIQLQHTKKEQQDHPTLH